MKERPLTKAQQKEFDSLRKLYEVSLEYQSSEKLIQLADLRLRKWTITMENYPNRNFTFTPTWGNDPFTVSLLTPAHILTTKLENLGASEDDITKALVYMKEFNRIKGKKAMYIIQLQKIVMGEAAAKEHQKTRLLRAGAVLYQYSAELIELAGKFMNNSALIRYMKEKYDLDVHIYSMKAFVDAHASIITDKRNQYLLQNRDFNIATETGRLEQIDKIFHYYSSLFDTQSQVGQVKDNVTRWMNLCLEQARKEVKGDEVKVTIDGHIQVSASVSANKAIEEAMRHVPINSIVIGLVAAKKNIDPTSIIAALGGSYYSKFNGFAGTPPSQDQMNNMKIPYPSEIIRTYNWEDFDKKNEGNEEGLGLIEVMEVKEEEKAEINSSRRKLMEILERKKQL